MKHFYLSRIIHTFTSSLTIKLLKHVRNYHKRNSPHLFTFRWSSISSILILVIMRCMLLCNRRLYCLSGNRPRVQNDISQKDIWIKSQEQILEYINRISPAKEPFGKSLGFFCAARFSQGRNLATARENREGALT